MLVQGSRGEGREGVSLVAAMPRCALCGESLILGFMCYIGKNMNMISGERRGDIERG